MPFATNGIAPPAVLRKGGYPPADGYLTGSLREGAVAERLKEKSQSKEDISVPTEENRGKHLIKGKSLLSYPPAPSTASRSPSLPEGGRIKVKSEK